MVGSVSRSSDRILLIGIFNLTMVSRFTTGCQCTFESWPGLESVPDGHVTPYERPDSD